MEDKLDFKVLFTRLDEAVRQQDKVDVAVIDEVSEEVRILGEIVDDIASEQEPTSYSRS